MGERGRTSMALMPTSITTHPSFSHSLVIISALPQAAMTISASLEISGPFGVLRNKGGISHSPLHVMKVTVNGLW